MIYDSQNFAPLPEQDGLYNQPRPAHRICETDQLFFNALALMVAVTQLIACYGVWRFLAML